MQSAAQSSAYWPAQIIHVNEDGWALINRGATHGVSVGTRLLVVGDSMRDLRDLFAPSEVREGDDLTDLPLAMRTRRTYELLEVAHVESTAAIVIAARTPAERRPSIYRGPQGEVLVWVPLPSSYTWQDNAHTTPQAEDDANAYSGYGGGDAASDEPPTRNEQDDERWENALPLNGINVGDTVVLALPIGLAAERAGVAAPAQATALADATRATTPEANPFEAGRSYDWMQSNQ